LTNFSITLVAVKKNISLLQFNNIDFSIATLLQWMQQKNLNKISIS